MARDMKLRIRGNSLRLRVSQSELAEIAETGRAEDRIRFCAGAELRYQVAVQPNGAVSAEFSGDRLSVSLPRSEAERWLAPGEISIRGEQLIGDGERLRILVEKDFACLTPREGEDESDLFPNPAG